MAATPQALLFDLQGTCTDFFTAMASAVRRVDAGRHPRVDWGSFVADWRRGYMRALGNDSSGMSAPAWTSVRGVYAQALETLLAERGIEGFGEADRRALVLAWEEQPPWPDVVPGLARLKGRHVLGTLSNADTPAVVRTAKAGGMPFDVLFSAQMCQAFKPDPVVYRTAATWLSLAPEEIMLVACHQYDLRAAGALGFQTAFVPRPLEFGPDGNPDLVPDPAFTVVAEDFAELAAVLGC
ncbi:MAG: haloacid dehalogenase type II [Segniliparus sp.]|uniref:haloacid dehalogenase type II n=1 Tax=Segniliparus sp. TaxID=2804064 RepID=UPI003F2C5189